MADIRVTVPNPANYVISTSTNFPLGVSGLSKLIQLVTYAIITSPGKDIFLPEYGMGIRDILPVAAHKMTEQRAKSDVARNLMKIEEEIKQQQTTESNTSAESLRSLQLIDVEFDVENAIWEVTIRVTSEAGDAAIVTLTP
jgi:phage baseplate assembly protein W